MKTLRDVHIGQTARVVKIHGDGPVKRRIMDMGLTKSVDRFVLRVNNTSTYNYFIFLILNSFFNQSDNQIILLC